MTPEDPLESATEIAIIGFAGRFPGSENAEKFWENLRNGVESIRPLSNEELRSIEVSEAQLNDPDYVKAGAPLAHLDSFDAGFFGISPREAAIMDPQQRHFLECAWEALEHAGYAPGALPGPTGVFGGSGPNSYLIYNLLSDRELVEQEGIFLLRHTGNDKDVLTTRISYQMNLRGPSVNIQTACSTSLVAVHAACQSLLNHECDLALAGAVSFELPHATGYLYRKNEIQSQDGHCRAFDAKATGTVFGSGLGLVVLRRLSDAIAAGDTIHAIIKGSAINNDGTRKVGFLAPSSEAQVEVISEALAVAGVDPSSIDYIEAHGTGTLIGDPIELSALGQVFHGRKRKLQVGSVKTNIGHLDTAAGMAGLIKVVQSLRHREIPATLHFETPNPLIDFEKAQLHVSNQLVPWEKTGEPRRAGITSLGIGGTNAHVVLEEAPPLPPGEARRPLHLLTLSAKSAPALDLAAANLAEHLRDNPGVDLDSAAYTLHLGRSEFSHRRMIVCRDYEDAIHLLAAPKSKRTASGEAKGHRPVAFLFSGQGTQHINMGLQLYRTEPVFRHWIDRCAKLAQPNLGFDFREILYPSDKSAHEATELIALTWNAQPIIFAFEYALAQLWMSWGVRPALLLGHSLGEYVAACLSDVFALEDAVPLVCARGDLMRKISKGAMLAVGLSETELADWIKGDLSLAAVNAPQQYVVSGSTDAIVELEQKLTAAGIGSHRLQTSHAFHSRLLDPVLELFGGIVSRTPRKEPRIPIISNPTGKRLTREEALDPNYWVHHLRHTVQFNRGLEEALEVPSILLLEIGPGDILSSLARQHPKRVPQQPVFSSLPRSGTSGEDVSGILTALGNLWVNGVPISWKD
ncbi:type I polyketide synthase, partial [Methylacidiphilales bacterium]|nr:type I polyketide synthase [Candidatus Methylacidiphilales bacterium]